MLSYILSGDVICSQVLSKLCEWFPRLTTPFLFDYGIDDPALNIPEFFDRENAFQAEMPLILVSKVHILAKKKNGAPCCPLKPRVFHQTPHFPHPWIPYPGTPAPRFSSGISVVDPDLGLRGVWGGGVFFSCPAGFSSFCYFIFFCPK